MLLATSIWSKGDTVSGRAEHLGTVRDELPAGGERAGRRLTVGSREKKTGRSPDRASRARRVDRHPFESPLQTGIKRSTRCSRRRVAELIIGDPRGKRLVSTRS